MRYCLAPKVAILMGCYNGASFIREQLDSIWAQEYTNWCLYASDDGSTDETLGILHEYQRRWGEERLVIINGRRQGFCVNFLSLACNPSIAADYYAFCDQDDVWLPQKLSAALAYLEKQDPNIPQAYGGRTIYTDLSLKMIGESRKYVYPCSFQNALVQSIAGANTMVFNHAAKELLQSIGPVNVESHDWWLYIVIEGVGGRLYFDLNPYLLYRQHPGALVGANITLRGQFKRLMMLLRGIYRKWNDENVRVLLTIKHLLEPHNAEVLDEFVRLRKSKLSHRIRMLSVCGLYRQGWHGGIALFIAAVLKKL